MYVEFTDVARYRGSDVFDITTAEGVVLHPHIQSVKKGGKNSYRIWQYMKKEQEPFGPWTGGAADASGKHVRAQNAGLWLNAFL